MEIKLGKYLFANDFDNLVRQYYPKTKKAKAILFNGQDLLGCDFFTLGQMCLWIKELVDMNASVVVDLNNVQKQNKAIKTKHDRLVALFFRWRFINQLQKIGAQIILPFLSNNNVRLLPSSSAVVGLHFFSKEEPLNVFLDKITEGHGQFELFDMQNVEGTATKAQLRKYVFKELIDNVYEHSGKGFGYTAVREFSAKGLETKGIQSDFKNATAWEKEFYQKTESELFLEIVMSDSGNGLLKTLKKTYDIDESAKKLKSKELSIINYAFNIYTSSKSDKDQYIKGIVSNIQSDNKRNITGLYFVRDFVKRAGGYLAVRSGKSWLSYDYAGGERVYLKTKTTDAFPGVQYKIILPIMPQTKVKSERPRFSNKSHDVDAFYNAFRIVTLEEIVDEKDWDPEEHWLKKLLEKVVSATESAQKAECLVLDTVGYLETKKQCLGLLHLVLDRQAEIDKPIIIYGSNEELASLKFAADAIITIKGHDTPILCISNELSVSLLCETEEEQNFLNSVISSDTGISENFGSNLTVHERLGHIIRYDSILGIFKLRWSTKELEEHLLGHLKGKIEYWAKDKKVGILTKGRYLLPNPSNVYCEEFWNVGKLIENTQQLNRLTAIISILCDQMGAGGIIATSKNMGLVAKLVAKKLEAHKKVALDVGVITDPDKISDLLAISTLATDSVVILSDVIATGRTLNKILMFLKGSTDIKGIFCIVNAMGEQSQIKFIDGKGEKLLFEVIKSKQKYYEDKPPRWSYESIQEIDSVYHQPIASLTLQTKKNIWESGDSRSALVACSDIDAVDCGHFAAGRKHFSTFILTNRFCQKYGDEVVGRITDHIERSKPGAKREEKIQISHVIVDEGSEAATTLAIKLCETMDGIKIIKLKRDLLIKGEVWAKDLNEEIKDCIIIETAITSGETARGLITYATSPSLKNRVFVFVLVERLDKINSYLFSNSTQISESYVEYRRFMSLPIRPYSDVDCPQCCSFDEYTALAGMIDSTYASNYLRYRESYFSFTPISKYKDPNLQVDRLRRTEVLEEAYMQVCFHQAQHDVGLRHELAAKIPVEHDDSMKCCGAILAYDRKAPLFRSKTGILREVFYPSMRKRFVDLCVAHLDKNRITDVVFSSAARCFIELLVNDPSGQLKNWPGNLGSDPKVYATLLLELGRVYVNEPNSSAKIAIANEIYLNVCEILSEHNLMEKLPDLQDIVTAVSDLKGEPVNGENGKLTSFTPQASWEYINTLLKPHRDTATALGYLEGLIIKERNLDGWRAIYRDWWKKRVYDKIKNIILPSLRRLHIGGQIRSSMPDWPIGSNLMQELTLSTNSVMDTFKSIITAESEEQLISLELQQLPAKIKDVKSCLFGPTTSVISALGELTTRSIPALSASLKIAAERLDDHDINCHIVLEELPEEKAIFVTKTILLTCFETIIANIIEHAYSDECDKEKHVNVLGTVSEDKIYQITVKDNGIGVVSETQKSEKDDKRERGFEALKRYCNAFDAKITFNNADDGFIVVLYWPLVQL